MSLTILIIDDDALGAEVRSRLASLAVHVDASNIDETLAELIPSKRLAVNVRTGDVTCDGRRIGLSALELALLRYLSEREGEIVTRQELLDHVWGYDAMPVTRTVDVRIAQLRRKLEPDPRSPQFILTVHRLGYKFLSAPGAR